MLTSIDGITAHPKRKIRSTMDVTCFSRDHIDKHALVSYQLDISVKTRFSASAATNVEWRQRSQCPLLIDEHRFLAKGSHEKNGCLFGQHLRPENKDITTNYSYFTIVFKNDVIAICPIFKSRRSLHIYVNRTTISKVLIARGLETLLSWIFGYKSFSKIYL